jgi:hypothetical protein
MASSRAGLLALAFISMFDGMLAPGCFPGAIKGQHRRLHPLVELILSALECAADHAKAFPPVPLHAD